MVASQSRGAHLLTLSPLACNATAPPTPECEGALSRVLQLSKHMSMSGSWVPHLFVGGVQCRAKHHVERVLTLIGKPVWEVVGCGRKGREVSPTTNDAVHNSRSRNIAAHALTHMREHAT
jgi:hypothetical protein